MKVEFNNRDSDRVFLRNVQSVVRIAIRVHALVYGDDSQNESDDKGESESDDKAANASNDKKAYKSDEKGASPSDGNGANESNEKVENTSDENAASPSPPRWWICPLCAFKNEPDILICDVCNTVKPFSDEEEDEDLNALANTCSRLAAKIAACPRLAGNRRCHKASILIDLRQSGQAFRPRRSKRCELWSDVLRSSLRKIFFLH